MNKTTVKPLKEFLPYATGLALPIMVQNLISTLVGSADTIMLGYVGQTAMSASSLANEYTFILYCFYYGLTTGTSVLCAQYWGKGDKKTVDKILGLALKLTILISALFFVISFVFSKEIMFLFTNNEATIEAGAQYLKVVSFSFVFMGIAQVYMSALRSIGEVVFPTVVYIISLVVNIVLNASFIFGLFGLPKLGVVGVALGTVIARMVETALCVAHSLSGKSIRIRIRYIMVKSGVLFKDFLKISLPSVVNDVVWGLAASTFAAILGHIGDDMVAANAVAVMVVNIGAIACRGFANATTIIVSQELGRDNIEGAKLYSKRMILLTFVVSVVGCGVMILVRPLMISFYADKLSETAVYYLGIILFMTMWRMIGEGINTCLICGCFRGGGDTRYGMILDTVYMWGVAVPAMALAAFVLKLSPLWVFFVMSMDEFGKMPVVFIHFFKYKWLRNITREENELV